MDKEIFIGARNLGEDIKYILPTYDILKNQIEEFRITAKKVNANGGNESQRQYNNTISLFGARGTGKTSAIYTLIEDLKQNSKNIILPVIEPDNFGENTKIIGSIIGFLGDAIKEELSRLKKMTKKDKIKIYEEYFNNCIYKENNPLTDKYNKLIEYLTYTEKQFRELLVQNFDDYATYFKKSSSILKPDVVLMEKLVDVINEFMRVIRRRDDSCIGNSNNQVDEPLLFIIIDDIDLKTEKCKELMDALVLYANHQNVITVLSGDMDTLKESITLSLLKSENLHENNMTPRFRVKDNVTLWQRKNDLALEYIKKLIPPALRHNLIRWNIDTIPEFSFPTGDSKKTLSHAINDLFISEDENIFTFTDLNGNNKPIKYSYSIFDDKPRGLINTYYYIHNFKRDEYKKCDFYQVKSLIDTIVLSSTLLTENQGIFFNEILIWGIDEELTRINYNIFFRNYMYHYMSEKSNIVFFILCEFLKNLLPNVQYDKTAYNEAKKLVFNLLIANMKLFYTINPIINSVDLGDNISNYYGLLCKDIDLFFQYFDVKESLMLIHFLDLYAFDYIKAKEYYSSNFFSFDEHAKRFYLGISSLFMLNTEDGVSKLLKKMYLHILDNKSNNFNYLITFLKDCSQETEEVEKVKDLFGGLINKYYDSIKNSKSDYLIEKVLNIINSQDLGYYKFTEYDLLLLIQKLFINWLVICIDRGAEAETDKIEENKELKQLYDLLNKAIENGMDKEKDNNRDNERFYTILDQKIQRFERELVEKIKEDFLYNLESNNIIEKNNKDFNDYCENFIGSIEKSNPLTKANKAYNLILQNKNQNGFNNTTLIYGYICRLARNHRLSRGYYEANQFRESILSNLTIDSEEITFKEVYSKDKDDITVICIKDIETILYLIARYKEKYSKTFSETSTLNAIKPKMKALLSNSYVAAMDEYKNDLSDIGLDNDDIINHIEYDKEDTNSAE